MAILEFATDPRNMREIASYQRAILWCILGGLFVFGSNFFLDYIWPAPPQWARWALEGSFFAIVIAAAFFVFRLSTRLYGTAVGIVLALLTVVPCVGLLVLLDINLKATEILRQHGIKVGLMGAKL